MKTTPQSDLCITWKRMEKGPRGGGGGIAVFANGMLALIVPDSPLSERLITLLCAAPDLLKSLKEALETCTNLMDDDGVGDPLAPWKAAIAKAEMAQ